MGSRKYNPIYQLLVQGDDDLIGQVAYALYKKEKHTWVEQFLKEQGIEPTDDQVADFHRIVCSEESRYRFRLQAQRIVLRTIDSLTAETLQQAQERLDHNHREQLSKIIAPLIPSFWSGVGQGIVASFLFSLLIVLTILIAQWGGIDFKVLFGWIA